MDAKTDTKGYDLFKLIVAIILLIIFILLLLRPAAAPTAPAATQAPAAIQPAATALPPAAAPTLALPPFPAAPVKLTFDSATNRLMTPDGKPAYTLDAAGGKWLPIIPDDLLGKLPKGYEMRQDASGWAIYSPDGQLLYRWEPDRLSWNAPAALELPAFPAAPVKLTFDPATNRLLTPDGKPAYTLDTAGGKWLPIIPDDLLGKLPKGYEMRQDASGWAIYSPDGQLLYRWDPDKLNWTAAQAPTTVAPTPTEAPKPVPTESSTPASTPAQAAATNGVCPMPLVSRLAVGQAARVVTNLNMRSNPEIGNNLILTSPVSAKLDVIGGPVCTPYQGRAYLWWQVKNAEGKEGWSAEGYLNGQGYFLEPLP